MPDAETLRAEMADAEFVATLAWGWVQRHEGRDAPDRIAASYWRRQAEGAEVILARAGRKVMEVGG